MSNSSLAASSRYSCNPAAIQQDYLGFRLAVIPEPSTGLLVIAGLLGLAGWRSGRAQLQAPTTR